MFELASNDEILNILRTQASNLESEISDLEQKIDYLMDIGQPHFEQSARIQQARSELSALQKHIESK